MSARKAELAQEPLATTFVEGREISVRLRAHATARRMILRVDRASADTIIVTVPAGASRAQALAFVERTHEWIARHLERQMEPVLLVPPARIPLWGEPCQLIATGAARGTVHYDGASKTLLVPGDPAHQHRRVLDWLKGQARTRLSEASTEWAGRMNVRFRRVLVRDQKSRWGSCSSTGDLSYSWRLILAPPWILDYVAAHEVAHLRHMDHSARYWRLLLEHYPQAQAARRWLRTEGTGLHRFQ